MATTATTAAGGGVSRRIDPASFRIDSFHNAVMDSLVTAYKSCENEFPSMKDFLDFMSSDKSNANGPFPNQDLNHNLSNYFISSSHNTYLTGHQLYGKANVNGYKNVGPIEPTADRACSKVLLRGCRCVEIDVWDGEEDSSSESSSDEEKAPPRVVDPLAKPSRWTSGPARVEPVVLHGYTATKDISFRSVCEAIRDNAFVTSSLPVIVSLEVHTCPDQQVLMVEIMNECFSGMMVDVENASDAALPSPSDLKGKILIKVKYTPPQAAVAAAPALSVDGQASLSKVTSSGSSSAGDQNDAVDASGQPKPSKIIESLSRLGVYMRSYHFKSFDQPEASVPTHVFSLSEGTLMEVHKKNPKGLFDHNKQYLMRAYPKGTRISSSNLDPATFWRRGVQMVALNWQKIDEGMMLNEGMFAQSGGWALKPPMYRSSSTTYPREGTDHTSSFKVEVLAGQYLEPPEDVDPADFKPYLKCEIHLEIPGSWEDLVPGKETDGEFKAKIKASKSANPDFKRQIIKFDKLPSIIPELGFVR
ncbi:Sorting nexin-4 [Venturia nashicola]|nr:Sorting nexin-4 [Venturia nashicola]